jgi:hypothetical protein
VIQRIAKYAVELVDKLRSGVGDIAVFIKNAMIIKPGQILINDGAELRGKIVYSECAFCNLYVRTYLEHVIDLIRRWKGWKVVKVRHKKRDEDSRRKRYQEKIF